MTSKYLEDLAAQAQAQQLNQAYGNVAPVSQYQSFADEFNAATQGMDAVQKKIAFDRYSEALTKAAGDNVELLNSWQQQIAPAAPVIKSRGVTGALSDWYNQAELTIDKAQQPFYQLNSPTSENAINNQSQIEAGYAGLSDEARYREYQAQKRMADAKANDTSTVAAWFKNLASNPVSTSTDLISSALPAAAVVGANLAAAGLTGVTGGAAAPIQAAIGAATPAALAAIGAAQSVGGARGDLYEKVMNADDAMLLQSSPKYLELRQTLSEQDAKRQLGTNWTDNIPEFIGQAAVGSITGRLGGLGGIGKASIGREILSEGVGEYGQQVLSNATYKKIDENQSLTEDALLAGVQGAVGGGLANAAFVNLPNYLNSKYGEPVIDPVTQAMTLTGTAQPATQETLALPSPTVPLQLGYDAPINQYNSEGRNDTPIIGKDLRGDTAIEMGYKPSFGEKSVYDAQSRTGLRDGVVLDSLQQPAQQPQQTLEQQAITELGQPSQYATDKIQESAQGVVKNDWMAQDTKIRLDNLQGSLPKQASAFKIIEAYKSRPVVENEIAGVPSEPVYDYASAEKEITDRIDELTPNDNSANIIGVLRSLGGIDIKERTDLTGERGITASKKFPALFKNPKRSQAGGSIVEGRSLHSILNDGVLNDYLPDNLKVSGGGDTDGAFNYISDIIRGGGSLNLEDNQENQYEIESLQYALDGLNEAKQNDSTYINYQARNAAQYNDNAMAALESTRAPYDSLQSLPQPLRKTTYQQKNVDDAVELLAGIKRLPLTKKQRAVDLDSIFEKWKKYDTATNANRGNRIVTVADRSRPKQSNLDTTDNRIGAGQPDVADSVVRDVQEPRAELAGDKQPAEVQPTGAGNDVARIDTRAGDVKNNDAPKFSRSEQPQQKSTITDVQKSLLNMFGNNKGMFKAVLPNVNVVQSVTPEMIEQAELGNLSEINQKFSENQYSDAQGFYDPETGKITLIADNLPSAKEARAVFLHEVFHKRAKELLGDKYPQLLKRVNAWKNAKAGTVEAKIYAKAKARADQSGETGARYDEELIAYAIEEAVLAGVEINPSKVADGTAQGFMAYVYRVFTNAFKKLFPNFKGEFTADDLVSIAYGAANLELQNTDMPIDSQSNQDQIQKVADYPYGYIDNEPYLPRLETLSPDEKQLIIDTFNENQSDGKLNKIGAIEDSSDIYAKSKAFQELAKSLGYDVTERNSRGKYLYLEKGDAILNARISDHSNVNRGYNFKESDINIAPDDGYAFDTFESALYKLKNATVNNDGDTVVDGEEIAKFSKQDQDAQIVAQYATESGAPTEAQIRAARQQIRDVEAKYAKELADGSWVNITPTGKPSLLTKGQWVQVRTDNFKKWFGESKVVNDRTGEPLVVYHGRGEDFSVFKTSGGTGKTFGTGAFFTDSQAVADSYANGKNENVAPVYLAIENPLVVNAGGKNWNRLDSKVRLNLKDGKSKTLGKMFPEEFKYEDYFSTDDLARWARDNGYDGVAFESVKDTGPSGKYVTDEAFEPSNNFVAFRQEQIKSSIGNVGTFDSQSDDIRFSKRRVDDLMDFSKTGNVERVEDMRTVEAFKNIVDKDKRAALGDRILTAVADKLVPTLRWIQNMNVSDKVKQTFIGSMYRAENIKSALDNEAEANFIAPLRKNIHELSKKYKLRPEQVKAIVGYWASARYAPIANDWLITKDRQALADAQASGDKAEIDAAQTALNDRLSDINSLDLSQDNQGRKVAGGMSNAQAAAIKSNLEKLIPASEIEAAAKPIYDLMTYKKAVDLKSGKLTPEILSKFPNSPFYVPLTGDPRAADDDNSIFTGGSINTEKDKAIGGRNSIADDAIDASFESMAKTSSYAGWVDFKDNLNDVYENALNEKMNSGLSEREAKLEIEKEFGIARSRLMGTTRTNDNVIIHKVNGQDMQFTVPPKVIASLKSMNVETLNRFFASIGTGTRIFARAVTQFNPVFGGLNYLRDVQEKYQMLSVANIVDANGNKVNSQKVANDMAKTLPKVIGAAKGFAFGKFDGQVGGQLKEFIDLGGVYTMSEQLNKSDDDFVKKIVRERSPIEGGWGKVVKVVEGYNNFFEIQPSFAAYLALLENGLSKEDAAAQALELTNFRKSGTHMAPVKALYAFSQPIVTGGVNLAKLLKTRKGKMMFAANVVAMSALYSMIHGLFDDDEGGNKLDEMGDITRFIPLPVGDGKVLKIPVGFGLNQLSWNTAVNLMRTANGHQSAGEAVINIGANGVKTFAPVSPSEVPISEYPVIKAIMTITPTLAQPFAQVGLDRSAFGSKISPAFVNPNKLKAEQSKFGTADFWKDASIWAQRNIGVDVHPEQVKNIVDGYAVGILRDGITMAIENPNRASLGKTEKTPFFNQIYGSAGEYAIQSQFYSAADEAKKLSNELASRKSRGDIGDFATPEVMQKIKFGEDAEKADQPLRTEKSKLTKLLNAKKISPELYKQRVLQISKRREQIQKDFLYQWRKMQGLPTTRSFN